MIPEALMERKLEDVLKKLKMQCVIFYFIYFWICFFFLHLEGKTRHRLTRPLPNVAPPSLQKPLLFYEFPFKEKKEEWIRFVTPGGVGRSLFPAPPPK